jgi:Holliday junction resolvase RusA-like endonuclease
MVNKKQYPITPCPAPRMTQSDKWNKRACVLRYFAFRDEVKLHNVQYEAGQGITFVIPLPPSYSKKKRAELLGQPHLLLGDVDNFSKALFDALFDNDSHIHTICARKIWGNKGEIIIQDMQLSWD